MQNAANVCSIAAPSLHVSQVNLYRGFRFTGEFQKQMLPNDKAQGRCSFFENVSGLSQFSLAVSQFKV